MTKREAMRQTHQENALLSLGFTRDEADALRRISMTLHRWHEGELSMTTVIAENPPNDGREWDAQCARCGSTAMSETCDTCGGTGVDDWGEGDWDYEGPETCDICQGEGGWMVCCSSREWCESHPMPGREDTTRGTIEWFAFDAPRRGDGDRKPTRPAPPSKSKRTGASNKSGLREEPRG